MYDQKVLKFVLIALILFSQTQFVEECFIFRRPNPVTARPAVTDDIIDEIIALLTEIRDTLNAALAARRPPARP